jgi:CO dehydrogenase maturation factor
MKIAVAGKGGTGKTTISALLLGALLRKGRRPVLAVDADPNSCFSEYLGIAPSYTLGEVRDNVLANKADIPAGVSKAQVVEYEIHKALVEREGFDIVTMGRTEGPGCYCYVNNLLRGFMGELEKNYASIVIDNEAGLEHLSRRTSRDVDILAVVADGSRASRVAAARIAALVKDLDIGVRRKMLIFNRLDPDAEAPETIPDLAPAGAVPPDENLVALDRNGESILDLPPDSPANQAIDRIVTTFLDN